MNVSKGVQQVAVPSVVGLQVDVAESQLQLAGFTVGRTDVDSDAPAGEVVDQSPPGNSTAPKGSSVTLSVSKGPATVTVPDVTLSPVAEARAALRAAGFPSSVVQQDTEDPSLDGIVVDQDPPGDTEADPKTRVTLTVGRYVAPVDPTQTDTTTDPTLTDQSTTTPVP
jgi:serine/threonine-protein kinase